MGTGLSINSEMEPPQAQGKNRGSRIENNVVNSNLEGFFTEHGLKQARKKGREKQLVKICFKSLRGSCCFKILPLCLTSFSTIFINLIFFCPLLLLHSVKKKKKKKPQQLLQMFPNQAFYLHGVNSTCQFANGLVWVTRPQHSPQSFRL